MNEELRRKLEAIANCEITDPQEALGILQSTAALIHQAGVQSLADSNLFRRAKDSFVFGEKCERPSAFL